MMLAVLLLLFVYSLFVDSDFYLVKEVSFLFLVSWEFLLWMDVIVDTL